MNKKFLFGMLVSGAMLAACTADDLNTTPVAKEVNPSAPVFTVSFDNGDGGLQNRAQWISDGNKVGFTNDDLLSLYHGGGKSGTSYSPTLTGYDNAIYEGTWDATTEQYTFTTRSLVNQGYAIIVYPGDTINQNPHGSMNPPLVSIPEKQDASTKLVTPYISEVIYIDAYDKTKQKDVAGYAKTYDIKLRRLASTLSLTLDKGDRTPNLPSTVEAIKITEVALEETTPDTYPFTKRLRLGVGDQVTEAEWDVEEHSSWKYFSTITGTLQNLGGENTTNKLITSDVDNDVAKFTLLPMVNKQSESTTNAVVAPKVVIKTNYGFAEVVTESTGKNANAEIWHQANTDDKTLTDGLQDLFNNTKTLWKEAESGSWKGEPIGRHIARTLDIDLTKINMNGLHITSAKQLVDALEVYKTLKDSQADDVYFILDGDAADENRFTMDKDAWEAVEAQLAANDPEGKSVHFVACNVEGEACTTIVLDNTGGDVTEVPELQFTTGEIEDVLDDEADAVVVELLGNWKYASKRNAEVNDVNPAKDLQGVSQIILKDEAVLELTGAEGATDGKGYVVSQTEIENGILVEHGATVNVNGDVYLEMNLTNYGEINIAVGKYLQVNKTNVVLENGEAQEEDADGWSTTGGVINVSGTIGLVKEGQGAINNFGTIYQKGKESSIFVSKQEDQPAGSTALKTLFSNGKNSDPATAKNRIGTIVLDSDTEVFGVNKSVTIGDGSTEPQGFIKVTVSAATPSAANYGTIANYVELTGSVASVLAANIPTNINYIEVNTGHKTVFSGDFTKPTGNTSAGGGSNTIKGLFIRTNTIADLEKGSYIKVTDYIYAHEPYAKFTFAAADMLNGSNYQLTGYFGGDDEQDVENVISSK